MSISSQNVNTVQFSRDFFIAHVSLAFSGLYTEIPSINMKFQFECIGI